MPRPDVTAATNGHAPAPIREIVRERTPEQQLSFNILADGQARLRLDVTGAIERISPILLLLMKEQIVDPKHISKDSE